jgi:hypothetical protein
MNLEKEIEQLKNEVEVLTRCTHRCCVCGKPTDGYVRTLLFFTSYYCRNHFPFSAECCVNTEPSFNGERMRI